MPLSRPSLINRLTRRVPRRHRRQSLRIPLGILFLAAALVVVVIVPERETHHLPDEVRLTAKNDSRRTWAQIVGGIFLVAGLWLSWENVIIAREGKITDRFGKAIDQLAHQDLAVRLGGIYALERIAFDSPRDHWTIVEVLTAYVREKARWEEPDGYRSQMASMNDRDFDPNDREAHAAAYPRVTADVQAILTVLGRRQWKHDQGKLDLTHLNLRGVVLTDAHFAGANLSGSSLEMALLDGAVLRGVTARRTWFDGAILNHGDLRDADLWGAQLMEAEVNDARLEKAKLVSAYLPDAEFRRSRLDDADLNSAKVMGTRFEGASLRGVDLGYAQGLRPGQLDKAVLDDRTKLPGKPDKLPQTI